MQRLCRLCLRIRTIIFFPAYHIWQQMYIVVIFPTAADSAENPGQVRRHTTTTPICGLSDLADSHRRGGGVVVGLQKRGRVVYFAVEPSVTNQCDQLSNFEKTNESCL